MQGINEDLTIDDNLDNQESDLEKQFLHPAYTWRGISLRPYSAATEQLFKQIWDQADVAETVFLEFVFIHIEDREKLKVLCWDKPLFRGAFLDWLESLGTLTNEDYLAAMEFFEDVRNWARKSSVEVIPDPALPEKKTKATDPQP
jgi:hypothetical protein